MHHGEVKKKLPDYLEGELDGAARARVDAHLAVCEDCAVEIAELEQTIRLLRGLPEPETPPMIAANVMRRIRTGETRPGFFERVRRRVTSVLEPSFMLPASAIAAAALVVVVVQDPGRFGWQSVGGSEPTTLAARGAGFDVAQSDRALGAAVPIPAPRSAERQPVGLAEGRLASANAAQGVRITIEPERTSAEAPRVAVLPSREPSLLADPTSRVLAGAAPPVVLTGAVPRRSGNGQALPVAGRVANGLDSGFQADSAGIPADRLGMASSEDARDAWIALGLERPADLAGFLSSRSLAEQELWVERLADRAEARGLLDELRASLADASDERARQIAADFAAEARRLRAE